MEHILKSCRTATLGSELGGVSLGGRSGTEGEGMEPKKKAVGIFPNKVVVSFLCVGAALVLAVMIPYWIKFGMRLSNDKNDWVVFGNYIGGTLGPGFTLLAFAGFIYTIHLQRREAVLKEVLEIMDKAKDEIDKHRPEIERIKFEMPQWNPLQRVILGQGNAAIRTVANAMGSLGGAMYLIDRYSPESVKLAATKLDTKDVATLLKQLGILDQKIFDLYKDIPDIR
jgi:hypothetical protein